MGRDVDDLSGEQLAERLLDADAQERVNAWARLVEKLGPVEASRRWLAAFGASDAAET